MLTKTNYILWRECPKNAWLKVHKPDIYYAHELSEFEKQIIETGNEVDELAREIFSPDLTPGRPAGEFQSEFSTGGGSASSEGGKHDGFLVITDVITRDGDQYNIYEVKATNDIDKKTHYHDLAFQVNVLEMLGHKVASANLVHLNKDYVRQGELDLLGLFKIEDVTETIREMQGEVAEEMQFAKEYIEAKKEPYGPCSCIYKGRSSHCSTFRYSNPDVPEYGVHDLARIGLSKRKLTELIDSNVYHIHEIPGDLELSDNQMNQIWTHLNDREIISREDVSEELGKLRFPLYFLDYETFPSAVPRFDGYSPYQQIPFQYSLHIARDSESEPEHMDFLYTDRGDPSPHFAKSLSEHIGPDGSVIVWHKSFECGRNAEIARRAPQQAEFFANLDSRIFDLEDIFKKQHYVHKDFRGSSSIKKVLPVLVPELTYKNLNIKEGGSAADAWNKIVSNDNPEDRKKVENDLREYCKLDTYAMYAIWRKLYEGKQK